MGTDELMRCDQMSTAAWNAAWAGAENPWYVTMNWAVAGPADACVTDASGVAVAGVVAIADAPGPPAKVSAWRPGANPNAGAGAAPAGAADADDVTAVVKVAAVSTTATKT